MATVTNHAGKATATVVENIGSMGPFCLLKIVPSAADATANTLSVTVNGLRAILGAIIMVLNSGNNVATSDADVTWSGNVLTIADGSTFDIASTMNIYMIVWGHPFA